MTGAGTRPRRRRGIPLALLAYGIAGAVLIALTAALLLVSLGAVERLVRSVEDDGPDQIATRLAPVEATLAEAELAVRGFESTLDGTSAATQSGRDMTSGLAAALRRLAVSLDVVILGTRPFAVVGAEFAAVADDAEALATDLAATTMALAENRAALFRLATELGDLRQEVATLRADLGGTNGSPTPGEDEPGLPFAVPAEETFALARLVLVLLLVWLAIPALVAVAFAVRQLRSR
jgi:hypothetical protein